MRPRPLLYVRVEHKQQRNAMRGRGFLHYGLLHSVTTGKIHIFFLKVFLWKSSIFLTLLIASFSTVERDVLTNGRLLEVEVIYHAASECAAD